MPTYEYKCDACGKQFEKFQSITADPIKKCPACGKNKVKRLISAGAGLIFKGSGFYITDYRDANYKDKAKADSGTTETAKTDAKPAGDAPGAAAASADSKTGAGDAKASASAVSLAPTTPAPKAEPKPTARSDSSKPSTRKKS